MANFLGYHNSLWKELLRMGYTGSPQPFTLEPGKYLIQCNGAIGGKSVAPLSRRAYGGVSYGVLSLNTTETFYAYVGGNGEDTTDDMTAIGHGGWNGGGNGSFGYNKEYLAGPGGGGATDVRLKRYEDCIGEEVEIPDGYQQIEYVETNGTQYVNLGNLVQSNFQSVTFTRPVTMQLDYYCNENSVIEFDCALPAPVNVYDTPWGSRGNVDHCIAYNGGTLRYMWAGANADVGSITAYYGKRIKITLSRTYCKVEYNGDIIYNVSLNGGTATSTVPIGIGSLFTDAAGGDYSACRTNVTVYGMRIYENDVLVKEYIPFKDTSDVYCIKETISGNLFYPLHGDLTADIETNSVAFGFRTAVADTNDNMVIVGSRHDETAGNRFDIHLKKLNNELTINSVYGNQTDVDGDYVATGVDFNTSGRFLVTSSDVYVNNTRVVQTPTSGESGTNPFYLFACYQEDTYAGVDPSTYFSGKLYHLKIYDGKTGNDYNVTDDCPYYFDTQVTCTIAGRVFTKRSSGPAFGCMYHCEGWSDMMFISKNSDDVIVDVPGYVKQPISFTYNGETWYFSGSGYALPGLYDDSSGNLPTFPTQLTGWDDPANVTAILDYIYENWGTSGSFDDPLKLFVPCIRNSDHAIGLLDVKNGDFYQSETTPLIAGPIGTFRIQDDIIDEDVIKHRTLNTRIIVAGGGGGGNTYNDDQTGNTGPNYANFGGGINGGPLYATNASNNASYASQTGPDSLFGIGMDAVDKTSATTYGSSGAGGGGGGWYGGKAITEPATQRTSGPGGGGSGYVVTASSIKPEGYAVPETFYMTDVYTVGNQSTSPLIIIYKESNHDELNDQDVITFPPTGASSTLTLNPGIYQLKCWGGDGGVRWNDTTSARGGYAEGILTLSNIEELEVNVAGSGIGSNLISSEYVHQTFPDITYNGGGSPLAYGDSIPNHGAPGGGGSDIRIVTGLTSTGDTTTDETASFMSRVIVAGGGGGCAAYVGGAGGGLTGEASASGSGTNSGPGTQTESPQSATYPLINGGFGYGGNAAGTASSANVGGAGGGGWYGGSGTQADSSGDNDRGGSGGSGYVLTESSYKPEGYRLDSNYYLTDTVLTTGGNDLPIGISKVEIIPIEISTVLILCRDEDGIKGYDDTLNRWTYVADPSELSASLFTQYGSLSFKSDTGLLDEYDIIAYDPDDNVNHVEMTVVPPIQHIECDDLTQLLINRIVIDAEADPSIFDVQINVTREPRGSLTKVHTDLSINKRVDSLKTAKVYYALYFSK